MKKNILVLLSILFIPIVSYAKMYDIVEEDIIDSLKAYADTPEFKKKALKRIHEERAKVDNMTGEVLPPSIKDYVYEVPYYYTLDKDIPKVDKQGNIIGYQYKKGYTFNPLLAITQTPPPMIIYNACEVEEVKVLVEIIKKFQETSTEYMLVSSGCPLKTIRKYKYKVPVYMLNKEMIEMFKLKETLSLVSVDREKGVFRVEVFATEKAKKEQKK